MLGKFRRGGARFFQPFDKNNNGINQYQNVRRRIFNVGHFIFARQIKMVGGANESQTETLDVPFNLRDNWNCNGTVHIF